MNDNRKLTPLVEGLICAMRALDNQVAREMQRTPVQESAHGTQKWAPYERRVEETAARIIELFGDRTVTLDSVLILSQAYARALQLLVDELGTEGLGDIRTGYCTEACKAMEGAFERTLMVLMQRREVN